MVHRRLLAITLLALGCATTATTPPSNTPEEIIAYVNRAAAVVREQGAAACDQFRGASWFAGSWYIFMFDQNGRTICHPPRPDMVGTNASELVDPNGKRIGDEFLRAGGTEVGGWVDYVWARPGDAMPAAKRAYVRRVTARDGTVYVIGSGGYELK